MRLDKKEFKELLLELLDDKKVQSKIEKIADKNCDSYQATDTGAVIRPSLKDEVEQWKKSFKEQYNLNQQRIQTIDALKTKNRAAEEELEKCRKLISTYEDRIRKLQGQYDDLYEKSKATFETQRDEIGKLNNKVEVYERSLQGKDKQIDKLQSENSQLQQKLSESFEEGRSIYEAYQNINEHSKQLLSSIFARDSFEAFICSGCQDRALQKIWDVTFACCNDGNVDDANVLFRAFKYFLVMVNNTCDQDIYALLSVDIGESFDNDYHIPFKGSRSQGVVAQIIIPGYYNVLTNQLLQKAVVFVE